MNSLTTLKYTLVNISQKGFFYLLSSNFLIQFIGFFSQLIVAGILEPEDIGRIKILQTYLGLATIFSTFGFNISVLKICSENRDAGEKKFMLLTALKYSIICSLFIYLILFIISKLNLLSADNIINDIGYIFFVIIIPVTINSIIISYLQAIKKIKLLAQLQIITKLLAVVFIISLTIYYDLLGYILGLIIGFLLTTILLLYYALLRNKNKIKSIPVAKPFDTHFNFAKYALLANILGQISMSIDIFLLNYLVFQPKELGYYAFALNFITVLFIIPMTVQQISIPYFSEKANNILEWIRVFNKYNRILIIISVLTGIIAFFLIPFFIEIIFKSKYLGSIPFFQILIFGWFFRSIYNLKGAALIGLGEIKKNFLSGLISLPINIFIMYFLIQKMQIEGAAYGFILTGFVSLTVVTLIFHFTKNKYLLER